MATSEHAATQQIWSRLYLNNVGHHPIAWNERRLSRLAYVPSTPLPTISKPATCSAGLGAIFSEVSSPFRRCRYNQLHTLLVTPFLSITLPTLSKVQNDLRPSKDSCCWSSWSCCWSWPHNSRVQHALRDFAQADDGLIPEQYAREGT